MPNCFTLTKKGQTTPTPLCKIDEEVCALLNKPVDPIHYCEHWYDSIGLMLACDVSWEKMRKEVFTDCPTTLKIVDYLEANYTTNAWYEHK